MKKKLVTVLGLALIVACMTACGSNTEQTSEATQENEVVEVEDTTADDAEEIGYQIYEFDTFNGTTVIINEGNIISVEACDEPLEWAGLPSDAEQLAPGRDCILFGDASNYYVEDATNKIVTIAARDLVEYQTYEFETFDGDKVVINEGNIISQDACDEPLEWADLPSDAEQLAPGRDCILFADATNYYVEDTTNKIVTVATKTAVEGQVYEFETFDGDKVVINEGNIVSQEACDEPLEWADLPSDAEQLAPGRDCILFGDATNYYVEDATNKLVTVASK